MRFYRCNLPATTTPEVVRSAQIANIQQCFEAVQLNFRGLKLVRDLRISEKFEERRKKVIYAFLNRACELACAPVHIRPVETSNGIDYAWYSYRLGNFADFEPGERVTCGECYGSGVYYYGYDDYGAISWECPACEGEGTLRTLVPTHAGYEPVAFVVGYERVLTEDQARSKAMGY